MCVPTALILLISISSALCYTGEYVPKSYYLIDHNGQKSAVTYFRSKRDIELFPLLRMKRGGGSSSSSSQSSAKASASSSSNSGSGSGIGGGAPLYQGGDDYFPGIVDAGFDPSFFQHFGGGGGGGGNGGFSHSFASSSSSSSSGVPGQKGFDGTGGTHGYNGPILFSRFGEDTGTGVKVSGNAQGPKGAFSASSSSIDSDGKITYSVKSGKY